MNSRIRSRPLFLSVSSYPSEGIENGQQFAFKPKRTINMIKFTSNKFYIKNSIQVKLVGGNKCIFLGVAATLDSVFFEL